MTLPAASRKFRSKNHAMNQRVHWWACLRCLREYGTKQKRCDCGGELVYFPSTAEMRRFRALRLEWKHGLISDLELQPSFLCVVEGVRITTYRADFRYTRDGQQVIEDVKGTTDEKYLTDEFKIKRKLVQAIFGITINIVTG